MKIKSGYIMREVAGNYVVVPTNEATLDFNGMITLNGTGAFLWGHLSENKNEQELIGMLLEEYDINETTAKTDIYEFLTKLKEADLIE